MAQIVSASPPEKFVPLWTDYFEHYAFFGGRGGAKSHSVAEYLVLAGHSKKERIVCGRQYQNTMRDSVKELIETKIRKFGLEKYHKITETEIINLRTGTRYTFLGMDRNPDSAKSLEGATIFWGEEAQTFTETSVEIIIPTIRALGSRMIWTWNPRLRTDPVDYMFRNKTFIPENSYIAHVNYDDNPYFYSTRMPSERRRAERVDYQRYRHIWLGEYDENPDQVVFRSWSVGRPTVPMPNSAIGLMAIDFGYSVDPTAVIKLYLIPEWDCIYVQQEAVAHRVTNSMLPSFVDTVYGARDNIIRADSSRPETIEYLNSKGFSVVGSLKGAGSIKNGINFLQGYHVLIDPLCPMTAHEFEHYKWKMAADRKTILPIPDNNQADHCIDAIRYAVEEYSLTDLQTEGVVLL